MHSSYKKRLYTNALSLSTAVLLAFLAQGQVAADTVETASPATPVENVLKPEEARLLVQLLDQKWQVLAQHQKLHQALWKQVLAQLVQLAQKQLVYRFRHR